MLLNKQLDTACTAGLYSIYHQAGLGPIPIGIVAAIPELELKLFKVTGIGSGIGIEINFVYDLCWIMFHK